MILYIETVLHEVGCQRNDLISWFQQGLGYHVQSSSRANAEHHVCSYKRQILLFLQLVGQILSHRGKASVGHVAMVSRRWVVKQGVQGLMYLGRWFEDWVAEGEIKDLVGPKLLLESGTGFEHLADPGGTLERVGNRSGNGHDSCFRARAKDC